MSGGGPLLPGTSDVGVRVQFWSDDAAIYATPDVVTVAYHGTIEGTLAQAEFEFGPVTFVDCASGHPELDRVAEDRAGHAAGAAAARS